ncbi:tRNA pseudouridine synthase [Toxoplasma gondii RUB]|uniref:tRNA pseudouridine synthase n=1 Tax=Toxoplasma gondii RUB TaxID=935652 RepID=A0A086LMH7_TOXGO|nr:tRNA pseudouridine synthase [Toxoplasma gondii RUB]
MKIFSSLLSSICLSSCLGPSPHTLPLSAVSSLPRFLHAKGMRLVILFNRTLSGPLSFLLCVFFLFIFFLFFLFFLLIFFLFCFLYLPRFSSFPLLYLSRGCTRNKCFGRDRSSHRSHICLFCALLVFSFSVFPSFTLSLSSAPSPSSCSSSSSLFSSPFFSRASSSSSFFSSSLFSSPFSSLLVAEALPVSRSWSDTRSRGSREFGVARTSLFPEFDSSLPLSLEKGGRGTLLSSPSRLSALFPDVQSPFLSGASPACLLSPPSSSKHQSRLPSLRRRHPVAGFFAVLRGDTAGRPWSFLSCPQSKNAVFSLFSSSSTSFFFENRTRLTWPEFSSACDDTRCSRSTLSAEWRSQPPFSPSFPRESSFALPVSRVARQALHMSPPRPHSSDCDSRSSSACWSRSSPPSSSSVSYRLLSSPCFHSSSSRCFRFPSSPCSFSLGTLCSRSFASRSSSSHSACLSSSPSPPSSSYAVLSPPCLPPLSSSPSPPSSLPRLTSSLASLPSSENAHAVPPGVSVVPQTNLLLLVAYDGSNFSGWAANLSPPERTLLVASPLTSQSDSSPSPPSSSFPDSSSPTASRSVPASSSSLSASSTSASPSLSRPPKQLRTVEWVLRQAFAAVHPLSRRRQRDILALLWHKTFLDVSQQAAESRPRGTLAASSGEGEATREATGEEEPSGEKATREPAKARRPRAAADVTEAEPTDELDLCSEAKKHDLGVARPASESQEDAFLQAFVERRRREWQVLLGEVRRAEQQARESLKKEREASSEEWERNKHSTEAPSSLQNARASQAKRTQQPPSPHTAPATVPDGQEANEAEQDEKGEEKVDDDHGLDTFREDPDLVPNVDDEKDEASRIASRMPLVAPPIVLRPASRTDRGVHAAGAICQYVSYYHPLHIPLESFAAGVNRRLPPDVRILAALDLNLLADQGLFLDYSKPLLPGCADAGQDSSETSKGREGEGTHRKGNTNDDSNKEEDNRDDESKGVEHKGEGNQGEHRGEAQGDTTQTGVTVTCGREDESRETRMGASDGSSPSSASPAGSKKLSPLHASADSATLRSGVPTVYQLSQKKHYTYFLSLAPAVFPPLRHGCWALAEDARLRNWALQMLNFSGNRGPGKKTPGRRSEEERENEDLREGGEATHTRRGEAEKDETASSSWQRGGGLPGDRPGAKDVPRGQAKSLWGSPTIARGPNLETESEKGGCALAQRKTNLFKVLSFDLDEMKQAAKALEGHHSFAAFRCEYSGKEKARHLHRDNPFCTVESVSISPLDFDPWPHPPCASPPLMASPASPRPLSDGATERQAHAAETPAVSRKRTGQTSTGKSEAATEQLSRFRGASVLSRAPAVFSSPAFRDGRDLPQGLRIDFVGNRFLYKMVRKMVGALVQVALGRLSVDDIRCALEHGRLPPTGGEKASGKSCTFSREDAAGSTPLQSLRTDCRMTSQANDERDKRGSNIEESRASSFVRSTNIDISEFRDSGILCAPPQGLTLQKVFLPEFIESRLYNTGSPVSEE